VKVVFTCPQCEAPAQAELDQAHDWLCPECRYFLHLEKADPALPACLVCGNHELYKKKDFPHALGMSILALVTIGFLIAQFLYFPWIAWGILLGGAAVDGALYGLVGDVIVCYRCTAHYKQFEASPAHQPFELTIGERYRQERLRREQMKTGSH